MMVFNDRTKSMLEDTGGADHTQKAILDLSGTFTIVGVSHHEDGESIFIHMDEGVEPVYFNLSEAKLLIAALQTSIYEAERE